MAKACRCSDLPMLRQNNLKKIFHLRKKRHGLFQMVARWIHRAKVPKEAELLNVLEQMTSAITSFLKVFQELIVEGRSCLEPYRFKQDFVDEGTAWL